MPGTLEAPLTRTDERLGGQRQRLSIARSAGQTALPVYLFDDCFSALDAATDARLRAA